MESGRYGMSTSAWPHSCNSTLGRLATMSALRNQTDKRAHSLLSHSHCTHSYLQFLYEHFFWRCSVSRRGAAQYRSRNRVDPSLRSPLVSSFSACFSPTSPPLCHSTSTVAYFLQIHFLIGAAARRCCCAQSSDAACAEQTTHTEKDGSPAGVLCGCCGGSIEF